MAEQRHAYNKISSVGATTTELGVLDVRRDGLGGDHAVYAASTAITCHFTERKDSMTRAFAREARVAECMGKSTV